MTHAADMTLMSGFVLGGAARDFAPMERGAGMSGSDDGIDGNGHGGFGTGDMGGGFGGGEG